MVLTAGLGQWSSAWSPVQTEIARTTRACAWDRAGFGFSEASAARQDLVETTGDLARLLDAAGIEGPYVLVGHSAGGFESMLFADRHRERVAGMVLVDSTVPDQDRLTREAAPALRAYYERIEAESAFAIRRCIADLESGVPGAAAPDPNHCFDYPPDYPAALAAALRRLDADPARLATQLSLFHYYWSGEASRFMIDPRRHYGALPLIVLTAGERVAVEGMPADAIAQFPSQTAAWNRSHDALAALSVRGENRIVAGASHSIQRRRPEAVIAAVREVVEAARRRSRPAASRREFFEGQALERRQIHRAARTSSRIVKPHASSCTAPERWNSHKPEKTSAIPSPVIPRRNQICRGESDINGDRRSFEARRLPG